MMNSPSPFTSGTWKERGGEGRGRTREKRETEREEKGKRREREETGKRKEEEKPNVTKAHSKGKENGNEKGNEPYRPQDHLIFDEHSDDVDSSLSLLHLIDGWLCFRFWGQEQVRRYNHGDVVQTHLVLLLKGHDCIKELQKNLERKDKQTINKLYDKYCSLKSKGWTPGLTVIHHSLAQRCATTCSNQKYIKQRNIVEECQWHN